MANHLPKRLTNSLDGAPERYKIASAAEDGGPRHVTYNIG